MTDESKLDSASIMYPNDVPTTDQRAEARFGVSQSQDAPKADKPVDKTALLYPDDKPKDSAEARYGKPEEQQAEEPVHGAPDRGYALEAPEGLEMTSDVIRELSPTLKALNLSNAGAQKLMPHAKNFHDRIIKGQHDAHAAISAEWAREVKADADLGRGNYAETERYVAAALKAAGDDPELMDLLEQSKLGNHPAFVRAFRNFGRRLAEKGR